MKAPNALNRDDTVHGTYYYLASEADKIIDELRAEIERLNAGWYDKLLAATLERDALRKDCALLDEVCEQLIIGAVNTVDIVQDADRLAVENAAQRKVLVQALEALRYLSTDSDGNYIDDDGEAAITAIQEQLNEHN